MRFLLSAIALLLCSYSFAQSPDAFWKNRCKFTTDGTGNSAGLKVKFSVPCDWKEEKDGKAKAVKIFQTDIGESVLMEMIKIEVPQKPWTKAETDELFTPQGLRKAAGKSKDITYIEGQKIKIDNVDFAEVISKTVKDVLLLKMTIYVQQYIGVYNGRTVTMSYTVSATSEEEALRALNVYKVLFRNLATATDFQ